MKKLLLALLSVVLMLSCCATAVACTEYCGLPFFNTGAPSEDELQMAAIQRINRDGDKIIGKSAVVQHYGNLRTSAYKYAESVGIAVHEDEYLILGYTFVEGKAWLQVLYGNNVAWISANLVEISGEWAVDGGTPYADAYVGRVCKITVNSGRARTQPDKASPIVEYVDYGEKYTILATASSSDNTLWFKIMKDGNMCWISSGIATIN